MPRSIDAGLLSQIKPTFAVPVVGMSVFGNLLALIVDPWVLLLHSLAVGIAIYTAHLRDTYIDYYVRGEDDSVALSRHTLRRASWGATCFFGLCLGVLWWLANVIGVLFALPLIVLAWLHAAVLDTHPVTTTVDYPVGVGCTIISGYAIQMATVSLQIVAIATIFVLLLAGTGVQIDLLDHEIDALLDKRTVAVAVGPDRARYVTTVLIFAAMLLTGLSVSWSLLPRSTLIPALAPATAAVSSHLLSDRAAFRVQATAVYLFTVGMFVVIESGVFQASIF